MKKTRRIGTIDFFKFIFAIIIVAYHAGSFYNAETGGLCSSGFIAVEFYFIVSGYLLAAKSGKYEGENVFAADLHMLKHKILHIFPYMLLAVIASNIFYMVGRFQAATLAHNLLFSVSDLFGLQMLGFPLFTATGVSWYISSLFFVSFLIYPLLCKNRQLFTKYIAPISAVLIFGYIAKTGGNLNVSGKRWGVVCSGLLRGYADIAVGCIAYEVKLYFDRDECKKRFTFACLEITGYVVTVCYAIFHGNADARDFFIVPLLLLSVAISFSNKSVLARVFNRSVFNMLGAFSLSIFLNHYFVKENLPRLFPHMDRHRMLGLFFAIVIVLALLNYILGRQLSKVIRSFRKVLLCTLLFMGVAQLVQFAGYLPVRLSLAKIGGAGTIGNPYSIDSKEELEIFRDLVNKGENFEHRYLVQNVNIDLKREEWTPIGLYQSGKYFKGTYDGDNHYIEGLSITDAYPKKPANVGFFGMLDGTVKNLGIESGSVEGVCAGGITSHAATANARIVNCYNKAAITGSARAGGICDNLNGGTILNCVNAGKVTAPNAAPIVSYSAGKVISVFPSKSALPKTFKGEYTGVNLQGTTVYEQLNSGIKQLIQSGTIDADDASLW